MHVRAKIIALKCMICVHTNAFCTDKGRCQISKVVIVQSRLQVVAWVICPPLPCFKFLEEGIEKCPAQCSQTI